MDKLYDYFIHYNIYTKKWNAVKRDKAINYMNKPNKELGVISDKDVKVLINKLK